MKAELAPLSSIGDLMGLASQPSRDGGMDLGMIDLVGQPSCKTDGNLPKQTDDLAGLDFGTAQTIAEKDDDFGDFEDWQESGG